MNARTRARLDQEDTHIARTIRKHGWLIQHVGGGCDHPGCDCPADPFPFGYTVGLFGLAHPELLVFGLAARPTARVLNALGTHVRSCAPLLPGQTVQVDGWPHRIVPEQVPNPGDIVLSANRFYQRPAKRSVAVLQLSYDDRSGRFPWDPGYSGPIQPRPGTFRA